jgi:uncharacterized membrane protein YphA (DoxX/SURF4 family)
MLDALFKPHVNLASAILRLVLAACVGFNGYLDLTAVGEYGRWKDEELAPYRLAVAWAEIAGAAALALGFLSRLAALGVGVIQVAAIMLVTGHEFTQIIYQRKTGPRQEAGFEYNLALIAMCLAIVLLGSGKLSVDYYFFGRGKEPKPTG